MYTYTYIGLHHGSLIHAVSLRDVEREHRKNTLVRFVNEKSRRFLIQEVPESPGTHPDSRANCSKNRDRQVAYAW